MGWHFSKIFVFQAMWFYFALRLTRACDTPPKHVVFVLADDLGYGDVGYQTNESVSAVKTPFIDSLAESSAQLQSHYTQQICAPTRGAFLTGRYPSRIGTQVHGGHSCTDYVLPMKETLLPSYLKKCGFSTHMVGKWHLGYARTEYLPQNRGFDTFYGYLVPADDYYTRYQEGVGYDLMDNNGPVNATSGIYESELVSAKVGNIVRNHNVDEPLFLYVAFQSVHTPIMEPPEKYMQAFHGFLETYADEDKVEELTKRRNLLGMVYALDRAVKHIVDELKKADMWENTLFIFTSDNGGMIPYASSYPLRGGKLSLYEGGIRVPALVHHRCVQKHVNKNLMHITDWLPTILKAVNCNQKLDGIDGYDQWDSIRFPNVDTNRTSIIHFLLPPPRKRDTKKLKRLYPEEMAIFDLSIRSTYRRGRYKLKTGKDHRRGKLWTAPLESGLKVVKKPMKWLELYDIDRDPYEKSDISGEKPEPKKLQERRLYTQHVWPATKSTLPPKFSNTWLVVPTTRYNHFAPTENISWMRPCSTLHDCQVYKQYGY